GPALTADPAAAIRALTALTALRPGSVPLTPAERVETAMAAFGPGNTVRRTVLAVVGPARREDPAVLGHLRARLAASGTQLFVLDLGHRPSPLAGLAAASGGRATRAATAEGATTALTSPRDGVGRLLRRQYHVSFRVTRPLPLPVQVRLDTGGGTVWSTDLLLPARNPAPPVPWTVPALPAQSPAPAPWYDQGLAVLASLLVGVGLVYGLGMLVAAHREPRRARDTARGPDARRALFFVFVLPCLNESRVIRTSVERLLAFPATSSVVLVVDDDSDDDTAAIIEGMAGDRVRLLRRHAPDARKGKGEALNDAVRHLVTGGLVAGRDPDDVIVVVVDADGRLDGHALTDVAPFFDDPAVASVQTGVRINNRHTSLLARLQDMEFVIFTQVFQRGRRHLGSVGLGGNGQFMRWSALDALGDAPWSRSLTEDLDLGVRLTAAGWRNEFCPTVWVHQQGLTELRRLIRQRTRWFQGHLQSWRLVPLVVRQTSPVTRADLLYHLSSPLLMLTASLLTASFAGSLTAAALASAEGRDAWSWWLLTTYLLTFGPATAFTVVYWRLERSAGLTRFRAWGLAHLYVAYGLMWYVAGWGAVVRVLRGRTGWVKTERAVEPAASGPGSSGSGSSGDPRTGAGR
ncbi:MAG: 1,2-diacylglycerol 3-beta-glucosyltransferase, partial [Actinomycetota bacterium]|nr:1,2-diacylglycerol 3-beta-glucosyltransferase [Actinomycetota bacterium]